MASHGQMRFFLAPLFEVLRWPSLSPLSAKLGLDAIGLPHDVRRNKFLLLASVVFLYNKVKDSVAIPQASRLAVQLARYARHSV